MPFCYQNAQIYSLSHGQERTKKLGCITLNLNNSFIRQLVVDFVQDHPDTANALALVPLQGY